jgi:Ca-activated chloride channel family protein
MQYRGEAVTRFEAVKSVFADFVLGNGKELAGRPDDLVGVIAFAGYPDTISPLTHSRDALEGLLKELDTIRQPGEDGTAIGDALALGAARLKTAEEELQLAEEREERFEIKSKVLILLTDGEQNAGKRSPAQGAALAREWGIKIYSIGVAASAGGGFSTSAAEMLEQIAESTGGLFRLASDERSLRAVYEEIDRLEKTEVEAIQYLSVREYFPAFALAALALLVLEILLAATLLRRLP